MSRPRVVFVDHVARLSGGEIALLRLLPALAEHVDVHVVLGEHGPLVERIVGLRLPVDVLPMPASLREVRKDAVTPARFDPRPLLRLPIYTARLAHRLRQLKPDLVHTNSLKAALVGGTAARVSRIPVLWHIRDRISDDYLPKAAVHLVHLTARIIPTAVVANSYATLATLPPPTRGDLGCDAVVPQAVEHPALPERQGPTSLCIAIIGRLAPWKGQRVFLEAFARAFGGSDVRGRVIGSALFGENGYEQELRALAVELGIGKQVEFRGFRENVWKELAELDVLVHASISPEPFGQVVLEGMAAGLPVVASAAGGPAELITSGVDGLLVPPDDVDALVTALRSLRDDPGLRTKLGRGGHKRSLEFTPERTARHLLKVYDDILRVRS